MHSRLFTNTKNLMELVILHNHLSLLHTGLKLKLYQDAQPSEKLFILPQMTRQIKSLSYLKL